jgi:hypothetical protein
MADVTLQGGYYVMFCTLMLTGPSCKPLLYVYCLLSGRLCGLVVRVPGYTTEMYCVSCEVRTEFIYVM